MAEVLELKRTPAAARRARVAPARPIARIDLSRPGAAQALNEVTADWLFERCSEEGRRKLLREHDLLAA